MPEIVCHAEASFSGTRGQYLWVGLDVKHLTFMYVTVVKAWDCSEEHGCGRD